MDHKDFLLATSFHNGAHNTFNLTILEQTFIIDPFTNLPLRSKTGIPS
jgi:hypothetical protein